MQETGKRLATLYKTFVSFLTISKLLHGLRKKPVANFQLNFPCKHKACFNTESITDVEVIDLQQMQP